MRRMQEKAEKGKDAEGRMDSEPFILGAGLRILRLSSRRMGSYEKTEQNMICTLGAGHWSVLFNIKGGR
mgnify:CR=1 FL=1